MAFKMAELVEKLLKKQNVESCCHPEGSVEDLQAQIDRGYAHIKFVETQGGTRLGIRLEKDKCDVSKGDFGKKSGSIHLVGTVTLDYENVRCHADIDLDTLKGKGYLEYLGPYEEWRKKEWEEHKSAR